MRRCVRLLAALCLAALPLAVGAPAAQARAHHAQPVVVELFTAQGCSSCVAADGVFDALAKRPGVLALTLAVDYWDYLGWADTFARPEYTARQRAYMQRLAVREVYTPQVVVDGKGQASGADQAKVDALITQAARSKAASPPISFSRRGRVQVGAGRAPVGGADVWLLRYDPGVQEVAVKRGENRGATLTQRNVVRQLVRLGGWYGKPRAYLAPPPPTGAAELKVAVLVQAKNGGRILGVAPH